MKPPEPRHVFVGTRGGTKQQSTLSNQQPEEESQGRTNAPSLTRFFLVAGNKRCCLKQRQPRRGGRPTRRVAVGTTNMQSTDEERRETKPTDDVQRITAVYASHLYCTLKVDPHGKGESGTLPLPPTCGVRPYSNTNSLSGVGA